MWQEMWPLLSLQEMFSGMHDAAPTPVCCRAKQHVVNVWMASMAVRAYPGVELKLLSTDCKMLTSCSCKEYSHPIPSSKKCVRLSFEADLLQNNKL